MHIFSSNAELLPIDLLQPPLSTSHFSPRLCLVFASFLPLQYLTAALWGQKKPPLSLKSLFFGKVEHNSSFITPYLSFIVFFLSTFYLLCVLCSVRCVEAEQKWKAWGEGVKKMLPPTKRIFRWQAPNWNQRRIKKKERKCWLWWE